MASLPDCLILVAQSLPASSWMSVTTTVAPSFPSASAEARPMPLAPPVTSAIFRATRPAISFSLLDCCNEFHQCLVERLGLIDVRRVSGIRDHDLRGIWDLGTH